MWALRFWANRYWARRYWADVGTFIPPEPGEGIARYRGMAVNTNRLLIQ